MTYVVFSGVDSLQMKICGLSSSHSLFHCSACVMLLMEKLLDITRGCT